MSITPAEILERGIALHESRLAVDESLNRFLEKTEGAAFHCVGSLLHVAESVLRALGASSVRFADARTEIDGWNGNPGRAVIKAPVVIFDFPAGDYPADEIDALCIEVAPANEQGWIPELSFDAKTRTLSAFSVMWSDGSSSDATMFDKLETSLVGAVSA